MASYVQSLASALFLMKTVIDSIYSAYVLCFDYITHCPNFFALPCPVGRRRSGQDQAFVAALLHRHTRTDICGGLCRQRSD